MNKLTPEELHKLADEYATKKLEQELIDGAIEVECRLNSTTTARGDFIFSSLSLGLGKSKFCKMISSAFLKCRRLSLGTKNGIPVLFPKLTFIYDEELHGPGKELEDTFLEAVDCTMRAQYPDFLSHSGDGYAPSMYKKYGITISRMGCVSGSEYITLKINGTAAKVEFKHAWEKLSKLFEVKSQKDLGYDSGEYIDLENVSILDKDEFVKCSRIIKNEPSNDWYLVNTDSGFSLVCTHDHVWTVNDNQTRFTTDLVIGDAVLVNDRNEIKVSAITNIKPLDITKESYDVTTETAHFICSGIRSHNCRANLSPWYERGGMEPADDLYEIEYEDGSKELVDKETYNKIISNE